MFGKNATENIVSLRSRVDRSVLTHHLKTTSINTVVFKQFNNYTSLNDWISRQLPHPPEKNDVLHMIFERCL